MNYTQEKEIAKRAELKLTSSLRNRTKSFGEHYRKETETSIKDAFAKAKVKRYKNKTTGRISYFMRNLAIKMPKHGFYLHYGVDTLRIGGTRTRTKPKNTTYQYVTHQFKVKETPFLDSVIKDSGVIPFVVENITESRMNTYNQELNFVFQEMREIDI